MSFLSREVSFRKVEHDIVTLGLLIPDMVFSFTDILNRTIAQTALTKFSEVVDFKETLRANCSALISYGVIAVGSYLNGQRIMSGENLSKTIGLLKEIVCMSGKRHIGPPLLEELIAYFNTFEYDRFFQARKVIERHYLDNVDTDKLNSNQREEVFKEKVPVLEYSCTYYVLLIDKKMNKRSYDNQKKMQEQYSAMLAREMGLDFGFLDLMFEAFAK